MMSVPIKRSARRKSIARFLVITLTLFGLFATHLFVFFVGRLEGMQNARGETLVMANGLYESIATPERIGSWSTTAKAMSALERRMSMQHID